MKTSLRLLASALVAITLMSCASALERRITSNPQIYNSLTTKDQLLVQQGQIREGMTKEAVFLSYGRPDAVSNGKQKGASIEKWIFMDSQPVYADNMGWGGGWGGYGGGWGGAWGGYRGRGCGYYGGWDPYYMNMAPTVMYVPYKAATVTFRNNRVTEFLTGPQ
jgi:hypothetical protein